MRIRQWTTDLLNLLFPKLCQACGNSLNYGEHQICAHCYIDLPYTDFHCYADNPVAKQFWNRVQLRFATALFYFKKGTKIQHLIHHLKYDGRTEVGIVLGELLGQKLKQSSLFGNLDLIIPVPLHARKLKSRGYNQSDHIAQGVSNILNLPISTTHLFRNRMTASQTKKSRYTRYENMQEVFSVKHHQDLKNLRILLIDDVITTGATLESCAQTLLNAGINEISIAAIAFAD